MTFLSGELLAFLGALGLPVLVHLLNLRRRRTRDVPTLRFLLEIESTRLRRVRLTRWLLLLLRMLLLAALVLSFARPLLNGAAALLPRGEESRSVVLLLDDSASSQLPSEGAATVWERLREAAAARLEELGPQDQVWLLSLARPDEAQGPLSPDAARARLGQWRAGWGQARVDDALQKALDLLEETPPLGRQLIMLSDLRLELPTQWKERLPSSLARVLVQVPSEQEQAAPADLQSDGSLLREGRPLGLQATLEGDGVVEGMVLSLELEGETRERQSVAGTASGHWLRQEALALPLPDRGWLRGWLHLDGDAVEVDNHLPFVLHLPQRRRVALVGAPVELRPVLEAAILPDARYGQGLELRLVEPDELSVLGPGTVDQAVLLLGAPAPSSFTTALRGLANSGVSLFLMPHPAADARLLSAQLAALGLPACTGLEQGARRLDKVDRQHSLPGSIFVEGPAGAVEAVELRRMMALEASSARPLRTLAFAGDRPLLLASQDGSSPLLLLTSCPDPAWSALASSGLLAPLMQQGLRWLDGDDRLPGALLCGEAGEVDMPSEAQGRDWMLRRDGATWRCVADGRRQVLECPPLPEPGHYELLVDSRPVAWVAVRVPAHESTRPVGDLDAWTSAEAGAWSVRRLSEGREESAADMGPWLLGLALLLLAVEGWLAAGRGSA